MKRLQQDDVVQVAANPSHGAGVVVHDPYPGFSKDGQVAVIFGSERRYTAVCIKDLKIIGTVESLNYHRGFY